MKTSALFVALALAPVSTGSLAASFGSNLESAWAETPKGKFECQQGPGTDHKQVLKLGGNVIYKGIGPDFAEDGPLSKGIYNADIGCFDVVDSQNGYLVIVRPIQPPHYRVNGFAVINFNVNPLRITELAEGAPKEKKPIDWKGNGFSLRYHGYPIGAETGSTTSPKPAAHELWFDFSTQKAKQVK